MTSRYSVCIFLLWLVACLPVSSIAQPTQSGTSQQAEHPHPHPGSNSAPEASAIEWTPETPAFKEATEQLRKILHQLMELEIRFHNSDTVDEEKRYKQQWYELRESVWQRHREMLYAGLAEYLESPETRHKLGDLIFGSLERNVEDDCYEGMLPIAKALYENQYPSPAIRGLYTMCCLAENDFQQIRQPLTEIIDTGQAPSELVTIHENLEQLTTAWQEELKFREEDAAGPPLPQAKIVTTKGDVVIELFENQAPEAVANFISLAEKGFYSNRTFFLVLTNFLAQTGCPKGDGTGNPGYFIPAESNDLAKRHLFRGSVVLNLLQDLPDSGGSQFMISFLPLPELEENGRVIGRVLAGMQNVSRLNRIDPRKEKKEGEKDVEPDKVVSIEIIRKRDHAYEPQKLAQPFRGNTPPAALE